LELSLRAVIALLLLVAVAGCDKQSTGAPQGNTSAEAKTGPGAEPKAESAGTLDITQRGTPAPKEGFTDPDGKPTSIAAYAGKPVLVNLWATWCGPCVKELPSLDRLAARAGDKLVVLAVSQDIQGAEVVGPWWAQRNFAKLKSSLDPKNDLGFAYGSGMLPTTILYDAQGKEVWRIVGGMEWDGPRANTLLTGVF